jgi:hypothetical protein
MVAWLHNYWLPAKPEIRGSGPRAWRAKDMADAILNVVFFALPLAARQSLSWNAAGI